MLLTNQSHEFIELGNDENQLINFSKQRNGESF